MDEFSSQCNILLISRFMAETLYGDKFVFDLEFYI